jgi:hypothetical protein
LKETEMTKESIVARVILNARSVGKQAFPPTAMAVAFVNTVAKASVK